MAGYGYSPHLDKVWDHTRTARRACFIATCGYRWKTPQVNNGAVGRQARLVCGGPRL